MLHQIVQEEKELLQGLIDRLVGDAAFVQLRIQFALTMLCLHPQLFEQVAFIGSANRRGILRVANRLMA